VLKGIKIKPGMRIGFDAGNGTGGPTGLKSYNLSAVRFTIFIAIWMATFQTMSQTRLFLKT